MDTPYAELRLFIDGEWLAADHRETEPVLNPATGATIGALPMADAADLDRAAAAAGRAFKQWRAVSAYDRAKVLHKAANLIRERMESLAIALTLEQGKPLQEARIELGMAADVFDWSAEEGRRTYGRVIPSRSADTRWLVLREPVGPVAAFTPWNFPAMIPSRKIAAALATGCSMVIKPSEETPATVLGIARALADAGLPAGVLNVVYGHPAAVSERLIADTHIRKVTFTGSTVVGQQLMRLANDNGLKRTTMELGGHAPVLVFEDADIEVALRTLMAAKVRNAGQVCISPTRFYIHESLHDRFVARFAEAAGAIPVGDGLDPGSMMGPLANARRITAIDSLVADALQKGATLATGGERIGNIGNFYRPTVLANVPVDAQIMNQEPFGPIAVTAPFASFDEAITQANRLPYGLASYAFTQSAALSMRVGDAIEAGMVGINNATISMTETPFGGAKQSGHGSEGGSEGMDGYLQTKLVSQS